MPTGRVISFKNADGFGFIERSDGGKDLFVHWKNIQSDEAFKTLEVGQEVEFVIGLGPKSLPEAQEVRVINSEARRA